MRDVEFWFWGLAAYFPAIKVTVLRAFRGWRNLIPLPVRVCFRLNSWYGSSMLLQFC